MIKLLVLLAASLVLAYRSEQNTRTACAAGYRYSLWTDLAYVGLVLILTLFAGLRTSYNDTWNYISAYRQAPVFSQWVADPENLNPFKNPLFYCFQSLLKSVTDDPQWLIFLTSLITQSCFVRFFKRYSEHFCFSIFIYFTLGTFVFSLAALKQVMGMAIVTLSFSYLKRKQWVRYYLIVLIAMMVHTYAIAFVVLPLFQTRPWRLFTYLFVILTIVLMRNFESAITTFMEQANDLGKTLADYEVFNDHSINLFRLAVYAVPPVVSLVFQKWALHNSSKMDHVLIHMGIISLAFMAMGTQAGANMFARMATYFELGAICILPTMLKRTFDERSYRLIASVAYVCFLGFFVYANAINIQFDVEYRAITIWQFLQTIF